MNLSEFVVSINDWLNRDLSVPLVTSFVRMAEQDLSTRLRVDEMVQIDSATLTENRVALPKDWREADFIRDYDGTPLHFKARDEFYGTKNNSGWYTITGRFIEVGGTIDPTRPREVEMAYFGDIPPLGDDPTFMTTKYLKMFTMSTLVAASAYGIEDERAIAFEGAVTAMTEAYNAERDRARASGSALITKRRKGFG